MPDVLALLTLDGSPSFLAELVDDRESGWPRTALEDRAAAHGSGSPSALVDTFLEQNVLQPLADRLALSRYGEQVALLLAGLRGTDMRRILRRLQAITGDEHQYRLVRQEMTIRFFRSLVDRPDFQRLYVCSPWINPTDREVQYIRAGCQRATSLNRETPLEVTVITRKQSNSPFDVEAGLSVFRELGARVHQHPRLHTKLYIREPGPSGGVARAVVGSQNLTRTNHLELGIEINGDSVLINQLVRYFMDVAAYSEDSPGGSDE